MSAPDEAQMLRRLVALERMVSDMNREVATYGSVIKQVVDKGEVQVKLPPNRDDPWACAACHRMLAWYNDEEDVLRPRYKDFQCYIQVGVGGSVTIICRYCGEVNVSEYVETRPKAEAAGG